MSAWRTIVIATIVAGVAIGAGACSDGGDDPKLSMDDYVEQANAICAEVQDEIDAAVADVDPTDADAVNAYVSDASKLYLDQMDALDDLGTPPGDGEDVEDAYALYRSRFERWTNEPERAGSPTADEDFVAATKALEDYGLTTCATAAAS